MASCDDAPGDHRAALLDQRFDARARNMGRGDFRAFGEKAVEPRAGLLRRDREGEVRRGCFGRAGFRRCHQQLFPFPAGRVLLAILPALTRNAQISAPAPFCAVIGAGPAGLIAADVLSRAGACVTVFDHKPSPARKFLMAGRGGLNLTHSEPLEIFLTRYGAAAERLEPIIRAFPPDRLREFCAELGEETFIGSSGRVFPKSFKASPLLRALLARLAAQGVRFERGAFEGFVGDDALSLRGPGDESRALAPDAAVLALGGASWPRLGSDGGWTRAFDALGVAIDPAGAGQLRRADPLERAFSRRLRGPADQNHPAASRRRHGARRYCRHPRGARGRAGLCAGFQPARARSSAAAARRCASTCVPTPAPPNWRENWSAKGASNRWRLFCARP